MPSGPKATVTYLNNARAPVVSEGSITPEVICDFQYLAQHYFLQVKGGVNDDQKVSHILVSFQDQEIRDWTTVNHDNFVKLSFPEFITALRKRWLPKDWADDTIREIRGASLDPLKDKFETWSTRLIKLNITLRGTPSHLTDDQLRLQLEAGIDQDLRDSAKTEKADTITDFPEWCEKLRMIDKKRLNDRKRLRTEMANYWGGNTTSKRPNIPSRTHTPAPSTPQNGSTTQPSDKYPPKLLPEERQLLQDNDGCFKCRTFNAGHRANECNITLSGKGYKTLTAQDVPRTKGVKERTARTGTSSSVNMIQTATPQLPHAVDLVAAVFPDDTAFSDEDGSETNSDDEHTIVSNPPPLKCDHLLWDCILRGPTGVLRVTALIDSGAHLVLVSPSIVAKLGLNPIPLHTPEQVSVAITNSMSKAPRTITHYTPLQPLNNEGTFQSHVVHAVITNHLSVPLILGLPFLVTNKIMCNYAKRELIVTVKEKPINLLAKTPRTMSIITTDTLASIHERAQTPLDSLLLGHERELRKQFATVFEPLPHADELPDEPVARIRLTDPGLTIKTRNYACPRKWRDAWHTLLQQHLEAGRIRPSEAPAGSGAFIIPKADVTVLPRWVNDYRQLNTNTITDCFPLPRISDILTDCGNAKFFAQLDMTNSFFQTRMHPDDIKLTAVNTPWGLYEWVVMPMGIKNAPAIHQRRVSSALRQWIGRICHVYLDDIVIWSNSLNDHIANVTTILAALKQNKLYCNPKKTKLFCKEIRFLGHRVSEHGIEADEGKADRILQWPTPTTAKEVRSFLGLVRYLATFLPNLAEHTTILDTLTRKECDKTFPAWTPKHQNAFDNIKRLATSSECLTTIEPSLMPNSKIFVTTDASDYGSGAVLAFGPSYESARPVAYDSRSFKGAELNYPVHEKELLAIIRALTKWRTELLGHTFEVWTDHRTLEHLNTQRDLSRRQARWLELLSQFDAKIRYLPGDKNCVADALSRLPDTNIVTVASIVTNNTQRSIHTRFELEDALLAEIKAGYKSDPFAIKLVEAAPGMPNVTNKQGFWFIDERLYVPNGTQTREVLFRLAHDKLGHFGTAKTYHTLRDSFYWPGMRRSLENAYIPSCTECQRNKSRTQKPIGPLHPLPVPDRRCDSVAMDFIGPLPIDNGYDCILTITDRLGSDIRIIPTTCSLTAQRLAELFFREWYCENGLPLEIVSDRDKLFVSHFWKALHKLTGVDLKMSSSYHPETDGASERTNKTVIQCLRFAVERDQKGWSRALPKVRFDIMNTVNKSTGHTPFLLRFGKSPRLLPPLYTPPLDTPNDPAEADARSQIERMAFLELEAKDNLLTAKIDQAKQHNRHRDTTFPFRVGDQVVLSTKNRRAEYKSESDRRVAKFMPRYDGPYKILATNERHSTVTLELPNSAHSFPVFHTSEVRPYKDNDDHLFPGRAKRPPTPVTINGEQEFFIDKIVDERTRNNKKQYRVRWQGERPEDDKWLPTSELEDCEALDDWQARKTKPPRLVLRK